MQDRADITVIGAGAVGLAVAAQVAGGGREVYVLERNGTFGQETSSRNSGVMHAGIYYPENSLKARLCVSGNRRLYQTCQRQGIPHRRLGKMMVAADAAEADELESLLDRGRRNGVAGLRRLSRQEMRALEPNVAGVAAILSPSTGIVDVHALMRYFLSRATAHGARMVYHAQVVGIERQSGGYRITVSDGSGVSSFITGMVINCAGLHCDRVAEMAGIDIDAAGYRLHYCKGEFFSVSGRSSRLARRLVYPVPPGRHAAGVGIHITFDLDGRMRLGPSAYYVDSIDYAVDDRNRQLFCDAARRLLPALQCADLEPEMAGVRPKLQGPGEEMKDFVIREESDRGLPGFINLVGIESPGMTAAPAIAEYVGSLVDAALGQA